MAFGQPTEEINLQINGAVATTSRAVWACNGRYRIMGARSAVVTAPTSADMVLDLQLGTAADPSTLASIFDSADTKPTIASGAYVGTSTRPTSLGIINPGDLLVLVPSGSFASAANLGVGILLEPV